MSERPPTSGDQPAETGHVVPFRQRPAPRTFLRKARREPAAAPDAGTPVEDLARFEHRDEPDDFGQRMKVNLLAFGFTILLIGAGIWIATTLADTRKNQDCVLAGRRNCDTIIVSPTERY